MTKTFATYEQQLKKLGEDGLLIESIAYAEERPRDIGYFALVNGYKRLLRDPSTGKYRAGASFSDLVALYEFDSSLRELFSHSLAYIERKMRSTERLLESSQLLELGEARQGHSKAHANPRRIGKQEHRPQLPRSLPDEPRQRAPVDPRQRDHLRADVEDVLFPQARREGRRLQAVHLCQRKGTRAVPEGPGPVSQRVCAWRADSRFVVPRVKSSYETSDCQVIAAADWLDGKTLGSW